LRRSTKVFVARSLLEGFLDCFSTFIALSFFHAVETNPDWAVLIENYGLVNGLILAFFFYKLSWLFIVALFNEILLKLVKSKEISQNRFFSKICKFPWPAILGICVICYLFWRLLFVADNGRVLWRWIFKDKG